MKRLMKTISCLFLSVALAGCLSVPVERDLPSSEGDLPSPVVQWAETNVMQVETERGYGSGFWNDEATFITACHVVSRTVVTYKAATETEPFTVIDVFEVDEDVLIRSWDGDEYIGKVISCDKETDLAIIKPTVNHPLDLTETKIKLDLPERGRATYGPGFPLGNSLIITQGHWQGKSWFENNNYIITSPTIFGDSGSPAVIVKDGKVEVVGLRQWVANNGLGPTFHIVGVISGKSIQDHISQYNRL